MDKKGLQENPELRKKLRIIGFVLVIVGGICDAIAIIDFFSAFGSFNRPTLFWLFFIGMPLLFAGGVCLSYGYMGSVARYTSSEIAPVAKDTINYMVEGTKDSFAGMVQEFRGEKVIICTKCHKKNLHNDKYCDNCGNRLNKECLSCHSLNNSDASFCNNCGHKLD